MTESNGKVYLTREKLIEIENELKELKSNGRADMAAKIAEARGYGDLSENAEYKMQQKKRRDIKKFGSPNWRKHFPAL